MISHFWLLWLCSCPTPAPSVCVWVSLGFLRNPDGWCKGIELLRVAILVGKMHGSAQLGGKSIAL